MHRDATTEESSSEELRRRVELLEQELRGQANAFRGQVESFQKKLEGQAAAFEKQLARERQRAEQAESDRAKTLDAYYALKIELERLKRRLYSAKAERVDSKQLELEFAAKQAELDEAANRLGLETDSEQEEDDSDESDDSTQSNSEAANPNPASGSKPKPPAPPKGRRNLNELSLPIERIELTDAVLEQRGTRIGFEESSQIEWRPAGYMRLVIARAKYQLKSEQAEGLEGSIVTTAYPCRTFPRILAAPWLLAKILTDKFADGLPLYRQEARFQREGVPFDRGTLCRWVEDAGMTLGAICVEMKKDAFQTAFCISADATGIAVQPESGEQRKPCHKGHFFVLLADKEHVLFEYTERETSKAVAEIFKGYKGYLQVDAKSVYDILFQQDIPPNEQDPPDTCTEVGCWAHARRYFYEAAVTEKNVVAREALFRIRRLFELEQTWAKEPPQKRKELRQKRAQPELELFFQWVETEYELVREQRGLLRRALGYAVRQKKALLTYLNDGRLKMDNNAAERELRHIAIGRKAWLFVGSHDHAQAAANLFSLIASCRLHGLDPQQYLRDVIRIFGQWPRDRYLELSPKYWAATRARLNPTQLATPVGELTIPPPQ